MLAQFFYFTIQHCSSFNSLAIQPQVVMNTRTHIKCQFFACGKYSKYTIKIYLNVYVCVPLSFCMCAYCCWYWLKTMLCANHKHIKHNYMQPGFCSCRICTILMVFVCCRDHHFAIKCQNHIITRIFLKSIKV